MREGSLFEDGANKKLVDDCIRQLMQNDVEGPILHSNKIRAEVQSIVPDESVFEVQSPELCCLNFNEEQIRLAVEEYGSIFSMDRRTVEMSEDVGMLSQESHVALFDTDTGNDRDIEISLFPWVDQQEDEGGDKEDEGGDNDSLSSSSMVINDNDDDEFENTLDGMERGQNESMTVGEFMQRVKEEVQTLDGLLHSRDFCTSYLDMNEYLKEMQEKNRAIKKQMARASNHNEGQNWVSTNVARARSSKRVKGAQFGLTKFV